MQKIYFYFLAIISMSIFILYLIGQQLNAKEWSFSFYGSLKLEETIFCEQNGNWSSIDDKIYFKKESSFYFHDLSKISLEVLHQTGLKKRFLFELLIHSPSLNLRKTLKIFPRKIGSFFMRQDGADNYFSYSNVHFSFSLNDHLNNFNLNNNKNKIELFVNITDLELGKCISQPLSLEKKTTNLGAKKSAMVCSKMIFYDNLKKFKDLEAWIRLIRLAGYEKILLYKKPGELDSGVEKIFKKYKNFVQVKQLTCIPNLMKRNKSSNLKYFTEFVKTELLYTKLDMVSLLLLNECYLQNIDKFKYISAVDTDEIILPRVNISKSKQIPLIPYLDQILPKNYSSGLFYYGYYFPTEVMDNLCSNLNTRKSYLVNLDNLNSTLPDYKFRNFSVSIQTQEEYLYAKELCSIKENLIKSFLIKYKTRIEEFTSNFNRFFMIKISLNGKSVFNTEKTFHFSSHKSKFDYNLQQQDFTRPSKRLFVDSKVGFASHFRYVVRPFGRYVYNIKDVYFDLTYFNYFFQIIVENVF